MDSASSLDSASPVAKIPQKRPRPVLSCLECRRKKLKCSRTLPCIQCTKASRATHCSYNEYPSGITPSEAAQDISHTEGGRVRKIVRGTVSEQRQNPECLSPGPNTNLTSAPKLGIIEDLQNRVEKLENQLKGHATTMNHLRGDGSDDEYRAKRYNVSSRGIIHLKDSSTRYHGQNQKAALLIHFEEARAFMKKLETGSDNESIAEIRNHLALLQQSWSLQMQPRSSEQYADSTAILQRMLQLLPSRSPCNKLVSIYLENFESELRVLHKPSFLSTVDHFWEAHTTNLSQFFDFIPQLLCVLAIASSLDDSCLIESESTRGHGLASMYCDLVRIWLEGLERKQRLKLSTLQTQVLLLIAKQSSVERVGDMWVATGSLVRSAMTIGLHRDPSESSQIPIFSAEMRRRLWATIVEMDLQISITCGMPTMVCATDFTCGIPTNVNDADLTPEMGHPPSPRSFAEWSDCLPQVVLAQSLRQRLNAARLLGNIEDGLDYNEVVRYAKDLEKLLQDLPPPLKFNHLPDEDSQRSGRLMTRVMLDVHIRRTILNLYGPFAQAELGETNFAEARKGFIASSLVILCYQDIFDPDFADLDTIASLRYWDLFHVCCKNDMMHASLGVCLEIKRWNDKSQSPDNSKLATDGRSSPHALVAGEAPDPVFTTWTKSSLIKTVGDNIDPLMRRLGRFGSDAKDLLCISIVLNSVRTNQSPEEKEALMENGIRELITAYRHHLRKKRRNATQDSGLGLAGSPLTPLSQIDTQNTPAPPGFSFGSLADSELDPSNIDFDLAQLWQLDKEWD